MTTLIDTPWSRWYQANKEDIALKRKHRYDTDPEYREKALAYSARRRELLKKQKKDKPSLDSHPYTQVEAAAVLDVAPTTIRDWMLKGYFPKPKLWRRRFVFSPEQVSMLESLRDFLREHGSKTGVHSPQFEDLKAFILVNW